MALLHRAGWLFGLLVGWLVGWLVGRSVGWLLTRSRYWICTGLTLNLQFMLILKRC